MLFFVCPACVRVRRLKGFSSTASNFTEAAPRGFGDRHNSWAQAMIWWNGNLYVGNEPRLDLHQPLWRICSTSFCRLLAKSLPILSFRIRRPIRTCPVRPMALTFPSRPRSGAGRRSTTHGRGCFNHLRFSITPARVHRLRPRTGKKLPYDISFRGFTSHKEADGTLALYAFGVNSTILWDRTKLPPPRMLRTTDGVNWAPVPQTPGTFLGDLPFNPDHSSFRSPVSYNGKMFVLSGAVFGTGFSDRIRQSTAGR